VSKDKGKGKEKESKINVLAPEKQEKLDNKLFEQVEKLAKEYARDPDSKKAHKIQKEIKALRKKGANIDNMPHVADEGAFLHTACYELAEDGKYKKYMNLIKAYLDSGANVNAKDDLGATAINIATGNIEVMQLLIKYKADVNIANNNGIAPLHMASERCDIDAINLLLENGADVNANTVKGETPLYYAITYVITNYSHTFVERETLINRLVEVGADVNVVNKDGQTLMHVAAVCGNLEAIQILKDKGVSVNATTKLCKDTPLHLATFDTCIEFLIKNGANVNAIGNNGNTPLQSICANVRSASDGTVLLKNGAKIDIKNEDGKTALDIAIDTSGYKKDLVRNLLVAGASFTQDKVDTVKSILRIDMNRGDVFDQLFESKKDKDGKLSYQLKDRIDIEEIRYAEIRKHSDLHGNNAVFNILNKSGVDIAHGLHDGGFAANLSKNDLAAFLSTAKQSSVAPYNVDDFYNIKNSVRIHGDIAAAIVESSLAEGVKVLNDTIAQLHGRGDGGRGHW
jgi:ankyrin repeat protein